MDNCFRPKIENLYYGRDRSLFYLCVFRDAYTRENLGWHAGNRMDVSLVRTAYDKMMANHGKELKKSHAFVHHDQGSQYLSTDFRQTSAGRTRMKKPESAGNRRIQNEN